MTDLSKCTELVNKLPILYGPVGYAGDEYWPWQCVVQIGNSLEVLNFSSNGVEEGAWGEDYNLKLPEPEWIYVEPYGDGHLLLARSKSVATHRYQAGDPTTMEEVKPETMERVDE